MSVRPAWDSTFRDKFRAICAAGVVRPYLRVAIYPPTGASMYFTTWMHDTSGLYGNSRGRLLDATFPEHSMDWGSVSWGAEISITDQTLLQLFIQKYPNNTTAPWGGLLSFGFLNSDESESSFGSYVIASGVMNNCEIEDDGRIAIAHCTFDSGLGVWDRAPETLYTPEHQKCSGAPGDPDRSGDKGFDAVASLAGWKGVWGKPVPPPKRPVKVRRKGRLK